MVIDIIIALTACLLIGIGSIILILYEKNQYTLGAINTSLERVLGFEKEGKLFQGTHYTITLYEYNRLKLQISIVIVVIGWLLQSKAMIMLAIFIFAAFYPKKSLGKLQLPFGVIYKIFIKKDRELKDDELLEILSLLKNMMVQLRESPKGADYIIEYLTGTAELTKPAFFKLLNLLRLGKAAEAENIFFEEIGTQLAADTARILLQLDSVQPISLEQSLISIQNEMREIGNTYKQSKNEVYSDLILIPIIITIMLEFLNFLVIAYIGQLSELSYFFKI